MIVSPAWVATLLMAVSFTFFSTPIVAAAAEERTVVFEWYSFFDVPMIREVWERRELMYSEDHVLSWTYPVVYRSGPEDELTSYSTSARLKVVARNLPEINIEKIGGVETGFLPLYLMNRTSIAVPEGGTAWISWYLQYIGEDRAKDLEIPMGWWDGWVNELNGTITMDKNATMKILGITDDKYDDIEAWWSTNKNDVKNRWRYWLYAEGAKEGRVDIRPFYDYPFEHVFFDLTLSYAAADKVTITIDVASWGMECLLARWFQETFMSGYEGLYSDLHLNATIGPATSDVDLDTAVDWALYMISEKSVSETVSIWAWQAALGDIPALAKQYNIPISPAYPYHGKTTYEGVKYDYTPTAWNLQEGEILKFSFEGTDEGASGILEPRYMEPFGNATEHYSEKISYDPTTKTLTFTGPIDMHTWSHNTWTYDWNRLDELIPWGCPRIELNTSIAAIPTPASPVLLNTIGAISIVVFGAVVTVLVYEITKRQMAPYEITKLQVEPEPTSVIINPSKRMNSIDVMRAVAILLMIQVHFMMYSSSPWAFGAKFKILYDVSMELGNVPAPLFTFLVGMCLYFSFSRQEMAGISSAAVRARTIKRAAFIFLFGLAFAVFIWGPNYIFDWDILTLSGFSIALLYFLRKLSPKTLVLIAVFVVLLSPVLRYLADYYSYWYAYEYYYRFTLKDMLTGFLSNGYFPVFPWIGFPLIGFATAKAFLSTHSISIRKLLGVAGILIVFSLMGILIGAYARARVYSFYPASTAYFAMTLGIALLMFAILSMVLDLKTRSPSKSPYWMGFFRRYSRFVLTTYVAHHMAVLYPLYIAGLWLHSDMWYYYTRAMTPLNALLATGLFITLFYLLLSYWEKKKGAKYSLEWILSRIGLRRM